MERLTQLLHFLKLSEVIRHKREWEHNLSSNFQTIIDYNHTTGIVTYLDKDEEGQDEICTDSHEQAWLFDLNNKVKKAESFFNDLRYTHFKSNDEINTAIGHFTNKLQVRLDKLKSRSPFPLLKSIHRLENVIKALGKEKHVQRSKRAGITKKRFELSKEIKLINGFIPSLFSWLVSNKKLSEADESLFTDFMKAKPPSSAKIRWLGNLIEFRDFQYSLFNPIINGDLEHQIFIHRTNSLILIFEYFNVMENPDAGPFTLRLKRSNPTGDQFYKNIAARIISLLDA